MSYALGKRDPAAIQKALGQAAINKEALSETSHAGLNYSGGSPVKPEDMRYAGNSLAANLGVMGEFAQALRTPEGMQNVQAFEELLYNGPFSPLPPPIM